MGLLVGSIPLDFGMISVYIYIYINDFEMIEFLVPDVFRCFGL